MKLSRTLVSVAAVAALLTIAPRAQATPIISPDPLVGAEHTVLFAEVALAAGTEVTDQYESFGVTFTPKLYFDTLFPAAFPGIIGHRAANFLYTGSSVSGLVDPFSIHFTSDVSIATFGFATNSGISGLTALKDGVAVEHFLFFSSAAAPASAFVGFKDLVFDEIRVDPGDIGIALIDNIQFTTVPEPAALGLMLAGITGYLLRRRAAR